jgi:beta-phosphoglucomutase-like phosphatase (HAD superfamily)
VSREASAAPAWSAALDQLDADLTATEAALEHGGREPQRTIPEMLSRFPDAPMPAELAPRAEALLARTRRLESLANQEIEGIRKTLRSLAGHRPAPPSNTGRIVDFDA